jgi:hypothetical protein
MGLGCSFPGASAKVKPLRVGHRGSIAIAFLREDMNERCMGALRTPKGFDKIAHAVTIDGPDV